MTRDTTLDPGLSGASAGLLVVVVIAAAWMPARRAARIRPGLALLGE